MVPRLLVTGLLLASLLAPLAQASCEDVSCRAQRDAEGGVVLAWSTANATRDAALEAFVHAVSAAQNESAWIVAFADRAHGSILVPVLVVARDARLGHYACPSPACVPATLADDAALAARDIASGAPAPLAATMRDATIGAAHAAAEAANATAASVNATSREHIAPAARAVEEALPWLEPVACGPTMPLRATTCTIGKDIDFFLRGDLHLIAHAPEDAMVLLVDFARAAESDATSVANFGEAQALAACREEIGPRLIVYTCA